MNSDLRIFSPKITCHFRILSFLIVHYFVQSNKQLFNFWFQLDRVIFGRQVLKWWKFQLEFRFGLSKLNFPTHSKNLLDTNWSFILKSDSRSIFDNQRNKFNTEFSTRVSHDYHSSSTQCRWQFGDFLKIKINKRDWRRKSTYLQTFS